MRFLLALLFVLPLAAQEPATVTGRLLDQDDQPVVGARVEMTAMRNAPGTWKDVKVSSDARGRFRLRCAPGPDQWFLVSVEAEGLAGYKHTIRELAPGGTQDLGDLVLRPAGGVVGRIVDREGDAIDVKGWRVSARSEFLTFFARSSGVDGESGEFRIEDLPEGRVIVTARHGSLESDSVEATVEAGGEVYVELPYSGPDPSRRISARLRAPRGMYLSDVREVSVRDEAGERHVAEVDEFGFDTVFDDLEPGTYTLLVEDPRYEPIEQSVETGGQVDVQLVGAGKVKVDVVDAESGEAIPTYELKVVYPNANVSPNHAVLLPATGVHPPGTRVEGVVPGEVQLVVQVAGRPDVVQALTLEPGTELPVRFEVPPASSLSGLVLGPDGQPETLEVRIEWTPGEEYGHTGSGSWNVNGREIPKVRETVILAPSGEFHLDGAGEGKHALRVRWSEWLVEDVVVDVPQAEPLTIQRPPSGFVTGTLRAPLGLDLSQVEVIFAPKLDRRGAMRASMMMRQTQTGAGTFGFESSGDRFRAGPLPTGTHRVSAQLTGNRRGASRMFFDEDGDLATIEVQAGGEVELDLDVSHVFPCEARVTVDAGALALAGAQVRLRSLSGSRGGDVGRVIGDLEANVRYQVCLDHGSAGWSYESDVYFTAVPGKRRDLQVSLPLIERRVRFVDPDGAALAAAEVGWGCGLGAAADITDAAGHLHLVLIEGAVTFHRPGGELVDVRWESGDETLVVTLPTD